MKLTGKKAFAVLISLAMLLSVLPLTGVIAFAEGETSGTCGDNLTWSFDSTTGTLTISGSGDMWDFNYQQQVGWNNSLVNSLVIQEGVNSIGAYAFDGAYNMQSMTLPLSLHSISDYAFWNCYRYPAINYNGYFWDWLQISVSNQSYCNDNFGSMSLNTLDETNALTGFCGENLRGVLMGDIVSNDDNPFGDLGDSFLVIYGYGPMYGDYVSMYTPFFWENYRRSIRQINLSNNITNIGTNAFANTNINYMYIPGTVQRICSNAFSDCNNLQQMTIDRNPNMPYDTVSYDYPVYLPEEYRLVIFPDAFYGCSQYLNINYNGTAAEWQQRVAPEGLENGTLHVTVTCLDRSIAYGNISWSFDYTTETLTISGFGTMRDYNDIYNSRVAAPWYYYRDQIRHVVVTDGIEAIGNYAFSDLYMMQSVTLPQNILRIGHAAFLGCSALQSVNLPDNIYELGDNVFSNCTSLQSVHLPGNGNLTRIGTQAFLECGSLQSISIPGSVESIGDDAFRGCSSLQSAEMYYGLQNIDNYAFACTGLTSVTLPASIIGIGSGVFMGCESLQSVTLQNGITDIGLDMFSGCTALQSITLPPTLTSINLWAFNYCTALTSIDLPASLTYVDPEAFIGCTALTDINVAAANTVYSSVNGVLFNKAQTTLCIYPCGKTETSYTVPVNVSAIDRYAFYSNPVLQDVILPDGLTNIGYEAFRYCSELQSVTLPRTVSFIENNAFSNCSGLTDVYYNGTASDWAGITIRNYNTPLTNAARHYAATVTLQNGENVETLPSYTGTDITLPQGAEKSGYTFTGWSDGTSTYPADSSYTVQGDVTLTAVYDAIVCELRADGKYYINGVAVPAYYGLVEYEGNYYYIKDNARIVQNNTAYVSNTNGLTFPDGTPIPNGTYEFDADGKLIMKQGVQADDKYYINGLAVPAYYGLVEWEGNFYYIKDNGLIVRNRTCYINTTHDLTLPNGTPIQNKYYEFDADGKMIIKQGIWSDGKYYIDGVAVPSYYGLVLWEGNFYYIKDNAQIVRSKTCQVNTLNGLTFPNGDPIKQGGYYEFDADGKMIVKQGIWSDGKYYINGVAVGSYYGLVLWEGDYYYIKDNAQIVRDVNCYVNTTNDLTFPNGDPVPRGYYDFDADGKLVIKQGIQPDGKYYINGVPVPSYYGLVLWEGDYYYIRDNAQIVRSNTVRVNNTNGLTFPDGTPIPKNNFAFDADGKMIY